MNIKTALKNATLRLNHIDTKHIDAELLLCHILKCKRTYCYTQPEQILTAQQYTDYQQLITQRVAGMPIAYLLGTRAWWSLSLHVSPATLIPRAETELLIEITLKQYSHFKHLHILELGTGSGAIALALAKACPTWIIHACDISAEALAVAKYNQTQLNNTSISFFQSNWFDAINPEQKFDIIISNPPYLSTNDPHLNQGDLRFEPKIALISGSSGLDALTHIIQHSQKYLTTNGTLILEHGYNQGQDVYRLLKNTGYHTINCWQDQLGYERVTQGSYI